MKRHIYEAVKKLENQVSFSMPGHKSKDIFDFTLKNDLTETITTDNLLNPQECILKSQEELSRVFKSKRSYYMVNGSTGALHIAIGAVTKAKDSILIQRNCHKSIYNALVINDLIPEYLYPNYNKDHNLITGVNPEDIEEKLKNNPNIKAVVLVSPNYFGVCLRLKEIAEITKKYNVYLIVDEAHGTHLNFSDYSKYSAIKSGADIVVNSSHKTIPSLTQSAILHICNDNIRQEKIIKLMNLSQTTSPSYLSIMSTEFGVSYMQERALERLRENEKLIKAMKENLKDRVDFFNGDDKDNTFDFFDSTKILFKICGYTGFEIVKKLFLRYNIRLEMGDLYYALALSSVADSKEDFLLLEKALLGLTRDVKREKNEFKIIEITKAKKILNPRETFLRESEFVDLDKACGRLSSEIVCAYPPGIPILSFGELFNQKIIDEIKDYIKANIEVVGVVNNKVEVVK